MNRKILLMLLVFVFSLSSFANAKKIVTSGNILKTLSSSNFKVESDLDTKMSLEFSKNKEMIVNYSFSSASIWAQNVIDVKKAFTGLEAIKITYKSQYPLDFKLFQKTMGYEGNQFYQYHQVTLESSGDYITVTIPVTEFNFPKWVLDKIAQGDASTKNLALPLNLADVTGIHISPKPNKSDYKSAFTVKEIELVGVKL